MQSNRENSATTRQSRQRYSRFHLFSKLVHAFEDHDHRTTKLKSCYHKEIIKENNELRICHESIGLKNEQADSTIRSILRHCERSAKISRSCPILSQDTKSNANFKYAKARKKTCTKRCKKKGSIKKKRVSQQIYSMCMRRSIYNLVCTNVILYIYKQTGSARRYVQIRLIRSVQSNDFADARFLSSTQIIRVSTTHESV